MVGMAAGLKLAMSGPVAVAVGAVVAFLARKGIKVNEKCLQDCFDKCYDICMVFGICQTKFALYL